MMFLFSYDNWPHHIKHAMKFFIPIVVNTKKVAILSLEANIILIDLLENRRQDVINLNQPQGISKNAVLAVYWLICCSFRSADVEK